MNARTRLSLPGLGDVVLVSHSPIAFVSYDSNALLPEYASEHGEARDGFHR